MMNHYRYVDPEDYDEAKEQQKEWSGSMVAWKPPEVVAVDLNRAHVPMEVTQASKSNKAELEKTAHCNAQRFGLGENEGGEH